MYLSYTWEILRDFMILFLRTRTSSVIIVPTKKWLFVAFGMILRANHTNNSNVGWQQTI